MEIKPIRKAVFPVAGLGTRFLPATKAIPKEMLPIVDSPLIQYAVDEAREAGIEQMIFVTGRGKSAIEDHFDIAYELEKTMSERGKDLSVLEPTRLGPGNCAYVTLFGALVTSSAMNLLPFSCRMNLCMAHPDA
jgi:UTP--glucose-1-phosphate uridylyltransferase